MFLDSCSMHTTLNGVLFIGFSKVVQSFIRANRICHGLDFIEIKKLFFFLIYESETNVSDSFAHIPCENKQSFFQLLRRSKELIQRAVFWDPKHFLRIQFSRGKNTFFQIYFHQLFAFHILHKERDSLFDVNISVCNKADIHTRLLLRSVCFICIFQYEIYLKIARNKNSRNCRNLSHLICSFTLYSVGIYILQLSREYVPSCSIRLLLLLLLQLLTMQPCTNEKVICTT